MDIRLLVTWLLMNEIVLLAGNRVKVGFIQKNVVRRKFVQMTDDR